MKKHSVAIYAILLLGTQLFAENTDSISGFLIGLDTSYQTVTTKAKFGGTTVNSSAEKILLNLV